MTLKGAGLLAALLLAVGNGAAALPLSHVDGLSSGTSLAQQVRHRRYVHHWYGYWRHCPYWYEQTFWGSWRLHSPCTNHLTDTRLLGKTAPRGALQHAARLNFRSLWLHQSS